MDESSINKYPFLAGSNVKKNGVIYTRKEPSLAKSPFNNVDQDADIILRSSDIVDFYVHKLFLRKASPIFADMFTVAHGKQTMHVNAQDETPPLPVVEVDESSSILDSLLRIYYPVNVVKEISVSRVVDVLKSAMKYEMQKAVSHMRRELLTHVATHPFSVYASACALDLEYEASKAAEGCRRDEKPHISPCDHCGRIMDHLPSPNAPGGSGLSKSIIGRLYCDPMHPVTAGQLYRLARFIQSGVSSSFCSSRETLNTPPVRHEPYNHRPNIPSPDLIIHSEDFMDLPTHTWALQCASASKILDRPRVQHSEGLPSISVNEDGSVLRTLLHLCYPFAQYEVTAKTCTVAHISSVREVAERYGMPQVAQIARDVMASLVESNPLQTYFAASRYGWQAEIDLAKSRCLTLPNSKIEGPEAYVDEMENVSAKVYCDLVESWYHAKGSKPFMKAAAAIMTATTTMQPPTASTTKRKRRGKGSRNFPTSS